MSTFNLYDPSTEVTPIMAEVADPANTTMGITSSGILTIFNPKLPFSIGCIDAGVITNTTGQGQIYPTGRN